MSVDNVEDVEPRVQYVASASQTEFDYNFPIFQDADLVVDVDGVTKTLGADYTVSGAGNDNGGTVTFTTAPGAGKIVTIYRDIAIERTSDFQTNGPLRSATINDELDKITMILQQLESRIGRAVRMAVTNPQASSDLVLSSAFAGKYLFVNSDGELEPAASVTGTTLTQSVIAGLLNPQTADELSGGVAPTNTRFVEGDIRRYNPNGDGVGDDSEAFAAMVASGAPELVIADGTYSVAGTHTIATDRTKITMRNAVIKVRDETGAGTGVVNLTASDCDVYLEFDFNSLGCGGITVAGDRNRVYVKGKNLTRTAQSGTSESLVKVTGSHNTIWAEGYDLTDGGIAGAVPRVVSLQGTGTHNTVMLLKGRNVVDGLVTTQTDTVVSCVDLDDVTDNGLYLLSTSARIKVNGGKIRTAAEPIVIEGTDIDIANVEMTDCGAIGIENATRVTIIGCSAKHLNTSLESSFIASRSGNTTSTDITLLNCSAVINVGFGGIAQFDAGAVNNFRVYGGRYELHWTDESDAGARIVNHDEGNSVEYKDVVVRIVDDLTIPLDSSDILQWEIPPLSAPSLWADVYILNDTAATLRVSGLAQNDMVARSELYLRPDLGPYLGGHDVSVSKTFYSNAAPTVGTWKVGDRVFNSAPSAGEPMGWICVTAGTPGTWIPFGGIRSASAYTVTNLTPDRVFDADTATTAELADVVGTLIADLRTAGILQ